MGTNVAPVYRVLSEKEKDERGCGEYDFLVGPDDFECFLGEPEDRSWYRDANDAVARLNEQHAELSELRAEIARLTVGRVVVAEGTYSYAASAVMSTNRGSSVRIPGWTGDGESMGLLDGCRVRVVVEEIP